MAKEDPIDQELQRMISIGQANQQLWPKVAGWCRHLHLKDVSGGIVAQFYQLPIQINLSCPHAAGSIQGSILDRIAEHFIGENCLHCPHHSPLTEDNFGTQVLAKIGQQEAEKSTANLQEAAHKKRLKKEIVELKKREKPRVGITQLSVLKYVDALDEDTARVENSKLLLEAAKIEPGFFNLLALQGIAYYFDDELAGSVLLETVAKVLENSNDRPGFVLSRSIEALHKLRHLSANCRLLKFYIDAGNLREHEETIRFVISQCRFERYFESFSRVKMDYSGALEFLSYLAGRDRPFLLQIFQTLLAIPEKNHRLNTHYLLQHLYPLIPDFVISLVAEVVQSLEGLDDSYMDSADRANLKTIALIIRTDPGSQYPLVRTLMGRLSQKALASTVKLTGVVLDDDAFREPQPAFCQQIVDEFIDSAFSGRLAAKRYEFEELVNLSNDYPEYFDRHFNALLGVLVRICDDMKTFQHFLHEVRTKPPGQHATFNYLTGMQSWEIMNMETDWNHILHSLNSAIEDILEHDPFRHGQDIRLLVRALDSGSQQDAKAAMIKIISSAVKDPLVIISFLPDMYTYLLDPDAPKVRWVSIEWLDTIMDRFPGLITQTLLDLLEVFLRDSDPLIKGKSLRVLETLFDKMPGEVMPAHVELIIESLMNQYVSVHKTAIRICAIIFNRISIEQRLYVFKILKAREASYRDEDPRFCKEIIEKMIAFAADFPKLLEYVVRTYVVPYCDHKEPDIAEDFREILREIRSGYPGFDRAWLEMVLGYLGETHLQFGDNDHRAEQFRPMYNLSYRVIHESTLLFEKFIETRGIDDTGDLLSILEVLSYFELHLTVKQIGERLLVRIPETTSTVFLRSRLRLYLAFSDYDESCRMGGGGEELLQKIEDVLPKI